MAERQEGKQAFPLAYVVDRRHLAQCEHDVLVAEHDAFRRTGGPRGVDDRGDIVWLDRRRAGVHDLRVPAEAVSAGLAQGVEADNERVTGPALGVGEDNLAKRRQLVSDLDDLAELSVGVHETDAGLRVSEDVGDLGCRARRVHRNCHTPVEHGPEVRRVPFPTIGRQDSDALARGDAELGESACDLARRKEVISPSDGLPLFLNRLSR